MSLAGRLITFQSIGRNREHVEDRAQSSASSNPLDIDFELPTDLPYSRWPRELQRLHAQENAPRIARELRFLGILAILACLGCLFLDASAGLLKAGLVVRLGIVVPVYLVAIALAGAKNHLLRDIANGLTIVVFSAAATYLGMLADAVQGDRYIMAGGVLIGFCVLMTPMRQGHTVIVATLSYAAICAVVALAGSDAFMHRIDLLGFVAMCSYGPFLLKRRNDRLKDRNFLLALGSRAAQERLLLANQELQALSEVDPLTGLANRRTFERRFDAAYNSALATGEPIAIMMIDLDHFKDFNDTYGHPSGDRALAEVAKVVSNSVARTHSCAARFGGEEFIVAMLGPAGATAPSIAERIVKTIRQLNIPTEGGQTVSITASIGVVVTRAAQAAKADLIEFADRALYEAKRSGRNRVEVHRFALHGKTRAA